MLKVVIPDCEYWDYLTEEFTFIPGATIEIEHSLEAIAKWEAEKEKPFLSDKAMEADEFRDYVRCMTLTKGIDPQTYRNLSSANFREINEYMSKKMTATWFKEDKKKGGSKKVITSELIYYWMTELGIPFDCDTWHFNRLMTLIRVASESQNPKKMSKKDIFGQNRSLNAMRRAKMGSKG